MKTYSIGIDIGGTNIKLGLVHNSGKVIARSSLDTKAYARKKNQLIEALLHAIDELISVKKLKKNNFFGVGIGAPGLIDPKRGVIRVLTNIPGWKNVPLKDIIQKETKLRTCVDNDVNVITLGEWKYGAGKGYRNLVCITLGTGVGGGLILDNNLYRGEGYAAGEIGHLPLNEKGPSCACGGLACFERYVGNRYLLEKAIKLFKNKNMQLEDVFVLANKGNARAIDFWNDMGRRVGRAMVSVVNLLNPRLIIIGGGVAKSYKYLGPAIRDELKQRAMPLQANMVHIKRAKLGADAGLFGAHVLVKGGTIG